MQAVTAPELAIGGHRRRGVIRARWLVTAAVALAIVLVLGVAQLVLPGLAAQRLRAQLAGSGQVLGVSVRAFPALKLLWHRADSVTIRLGRYEATPAALDARLGQLADAGTVRASVAQLHDGLLTLHDATLVKHGSRLSAGATVSDTDLRGAVPFLTSVTPVASGAGQLVLRGTANVLGLGVTADATVQARDGALVVVPDVPFGALATVTVFSDPHIAVESISASPAAGGFAVTGTGVVR